MKIEEQIVQYKNNLDTFLNEIKDGTFDGDIKYIRENYDNLNIQQKAEINSQITSFTPEQESSPNSPQKNNPSRQGVLKQVSKSIAGALGLPRSLSDAKDIFSRNLQLGIRRQIQNPGVLLSSVLNPRRRTANKIQPEKFYSNQEPDKQIVTDNIQKYIDDDNGNKHLIVFKITNTGELLPFRMINFTGFTDSISVDNTAVNYFGRPEPFYMYNGVTRNISFNFDIVVHSENDINIIYSKLNTLISTAYPHRYTTNKMIEPNILKLSIGEYLSDTPFFLTTMTFTAADDLVFYDSKPSQISVSVQGNILQSEQYPQYDTRGVEFSSFVNNKRFVERKAKEQIFKQRRSNQSNSSAFNPNDRL